MKKSKKKLKKKIKKIDFFYENIFFNILEKNEKRGVFSKTISGKGKNAKTQ